MPDHYYQSIPGAAQLEKWYLKIKITLENFPLSPEVRELNLCLYLQRRRFDWIDPELLAFAFVVSYSTIRDNLDE